MELFRVVEGNQPQALPAAGHQQAFTRQQVALGAAVRTDKAAVAVFGIGDNFRWRSAANTSGAACTLCAQTGVRTNTSAAASRIGPPAENEYAVEPVGRCQNHAVAAVAAHQCAVAVHLIIHRVQPGLTEHHKVIDGVSLPAVGRGLGVEQTAVGKGELPRGQPFELGRKLTDLAGRQKAGAAKIDTQNGLAVLHAGKPARSSVPSPPMVTT